MLTVFFLTSRSRKLSQSTISWPLTGLGVHLSSMNTSLVCGYCARSEGSLPRSQPNAPDTPISRVTICFP